MKTRITLLGLFAALVLWAATETLVPDAITTQTNFTGALSTITAQDGTWMTGCGTNCSQELLVEFPTASGTLTTTANAQSITAWVRKTAQSTDPTMTVEVYDNGALYQSLSSAAVSSTTGVSAGGTWTATGLGTGSTVQARITCSSGGGPPGNRASCEIDYVVWEVDYTVGGAKKRTVIIGEVVGRKAVGYGG